MTSEVVVMNRAGVALAADSAVALEIGDKSKVRDSAVKLFMLSKSRPVGVMIYNNASLLGIPWETIIKMFRHELGRTGFDTLPEYGRELINFLDGNAHLFPGDIQDGYFLQALEAEYWRICNQVRKQLVASALYEPEAENTAEDQTTVADRAIAERLAFWLKQPDANYFEDVDANAFIGRNSGVVNEAVHRVFFRELSLRLGSERVVDLNKLARLLVTKDYFPPDVSSGLVIAGFGEKEHFPSVQHLEIGGVYGSKLKVRAHSLEKVSEQSPSHLMAFAYTDMVHTFLDGHSSKTGDLLIDAATFIREMPSLVLDAIEDIDPKKRELAAEVVRKASIDVASLFATHVKKGSEDRRSKIRSAVEALSIRELAHVAATLVGLGSFEQQMSLDRETVGGPVDVAVISKGDGFIWINRKHYFRRGLNEHFFQNYDDNVPAASESAESKHGEAVQNGK